MSSNRVIYYHQSILGSGTTPSYVSLKPIWTTVRDDGTTPCTTQLYLAAANMGAGLPSTPNTPYLHLNDIPLDSSEYSPLWSDVGTLQGKGVEVLMMLGGAGALAKGTDSFGYPYDNKTWGLLWSGSTLNPTYYDLVLNALIDHKLDGIGLDFEVGSGNVTVDMVVELVSSLRKDYAKAAPTQHELIVSLTPVASGLLTGHGLAGFDYQTLYSTVCRGSQDETIDSFNGQFYNGFGTSTSPSGYEGIINTTWGQAKDSFPPGEVVLGAALGTSEGGNISGATAYQSYLATLTTLAGKYKGSGGFGGTFAWTYTDKFSNTANPAQWSQDAYKAIEAGLK